MQMQVGDKVRINYVIQAQWWPQGENTGTIQKLFKNGKVAVAVDRLRNFSEDRRATIHFDREDLEVLA